MNKSTLVEKKDLDDIIKIREFVKKYSNDYQLGKVIRELYISRDIQAVLESHKLSDEIIDNIENGIIYESPDGGKTVFQRPVADYDSKNKIHINWETKEPTGKTFLDYPWHQEKDNEHKECL